MSQEFEYLDTESEKMLQKILQLDNVIDESIRGTAIEHLVLNGYLTGINAQSLSDMEPVYVLTGITQKGKAYFELKNNYEKEKRKLSSREWRIAIISAVIGAVIGLIPSIIQWIR